MISLFERNFDFDERHSAPQQTETIAEEELTARLEAARQEGFDAGRRIGLQDARAEHESAEAERLTKERGEIRDQLARLGGADAAFRLETERDIVELFAGVAERLVPELLETYGVDLAIDRIRQSVQEARTDPVLRIRACPDVIGVLEAEAPDWLTPPSATTRIDLQADPEMNRGAVPVLWHGRRLAYDLQAACLAMLQALAKAAEDYEATSQKAG